ncbi:MAG: c-type cytochrome, partial [Alphaproteobacteria bacterium]|nr:c-type cytochrome [Alphaproteobacteria bacterium]
EYVWHYQGTPGETWDYTHTQSIILADLTIKGEERKVLMQAPKNGFFFVIDRTDGSFISAEPYVPVTWAEGYDYETGRPIEAEGARFTEEPALLLPGPYGAHNWQPMAFNPKTGLAYIPALRLEGLYQNLEPFEVEKGRYNTGTDLVIASLPDDEAQRKAMKSLIRGHLSAWDPVKQEEAWRVPYDYSWNGGVMTTAGNLVFQGTADAHLKAYAADSGEELWSAPAQTGIIAGPVSYEVDGEQYISVMAGWGGAFGLTAAYFAPEINQFKVSRVLTFKLGGDKTLPPLDMTLPPFPEPPAQTATKDALAEGRYLYHRFCQFCHGDKAVARGVVVDLRRSASLHDAEWWQDIVIGGALKENGMVSFQENLTAEEAEAIRHYVIQRVHESIAQRAEVEE